MMRSGCIEQSPFNYAPLVGRYPDSATLLREALATDTMQVGQKSGVSAIRLRVLPNRLTSFISMDEAIEKIDAKDLPQAARIRKYLEKLAAACAAEPDQKNDRLFSEGRRLFNWRWADSKKEKTPKAIVEAFRKDVEKSLLYEPLSLSQKAAETVVLLTPSSGSSYGDDAYLKDRSAALQKFDEPKLRPCVII